MKKIILILLLPMLIETALGASIQTPLVIVNKEAQVKSLSYRNLLRIYTMQQKRWPNGKKIRVFTLPLFDPTHQQFVKRVLKSQPYQLERHWKRLLFSGIGKAPTALENEQQMLQKIKNTPGAIGYIGEHLSTGTSLVLEVK